MNLNQQLLNDLADQLGLQESGQRAVKTAVDMADDYKNMNEDALVSEIMNLKRMMKSDTDQYRKQIAAIKSLRAVMNEDQQKRLDKMIKLLDD